jgi:ankyrin repeat protein
MSTDAVSLDVTPRDANVLEAALNNNATEAESSDDESVEENQSEDLPQTDPFVMAIKAGDCAAVKCMLQEGRDMYATIRREGKEYWIKRELNVMHFAIENNHINIVELLLDEGYDIDAPTSNCVTPLMCAISQGNYDIVKYLLSRGAQMNTLSDLSLSPLAIACRDKHVSIAYLLLENGADPNNFRAVIMEEVKRRKKKHVVVASESELVDREAALRDGEVAVDTAVYEAALNGFTELVAHLISKGAAITTKSWSGSTPLSGAAEHGHLDTVNLLLQHGSDVNNNLVRKTSEDVEGDAREYRPRCRCCLNARSFVNTTPLHLAVKNGHISVVDCLLQHGADPNIASEINTTPLMTAAKNKSMEIVQLLLRHGAEVLLKDKFYFAAIDHACERFMEGDLALVTLLLSHCPPMYMLPRAGVLLGPCNNITRPSQERNELIHLLCDRLDEVQDENFCPIVTACRSIKFTRVNAVRRDEGAEAGDCEDEDEDKVTFYAVLEVVKLLLKRGADPNHRSGYKLVTSLHACHFHSNLAIIHALIEAGGDPNIQDKYEKSVLDLMVESEDSLLVSARSEVQCMYANKLNFDRRKTFLMVLAENGYIPSAANLPLRGRQDLALQNVDILTNIFAFL